MNKVEKISNNLRKTLKGNITLKTLSEYLQTLGYATVFFNTEEGDEILKAYGINPGNTNAFTYIGPTRIVFVNANLHSQDKIYALLHELGHILLAHIGTDNIDLLNKRSSENEAEAFAYMVLNPNKNRIMYFLCVLSILLTIIMSSAFFYTKNTAAVQTTPEAVTVYAHKPTSTPIESMVYVTRTGSKYHRPSCGYVQNRETISITIAEAQRNYTSCRVCNP